MKHTFVLTPQAETDLLEIWEFIAEQSLDNADLVIEQLYEAFNKLAAIPTMGHYREDLSDKRNKFWPVYSYLVVYRENTAPLQILSIVHGARELKAFFVKMDGS